jgi:uncharacterized protein (UPF0333 family)
MDSKAQATLEYLILLAVVLSVVILVVLVVTQMASGQKAAVNETAGALNQSISRL